MQRKIILFLAMAIWAMAAATATSWRVNPSPYAKAQYKTVEEAMKDINVKAGDTLLLDAGHHEMVDTDSRKNITVIGTGYFLDQNKQWAESQATTIGSAYIGEGGKIEGCVVRSLRLRKQAVASRCKAESVGTDIETIVESCFVNASAGFDKSAIVRNSIFVIDSYIPGAEGVLFENNIVYKRSSELYRTNNVLSSFRNSTIRNNILINATEGFDDNQIPYSTYIINYSSDDNNVIQNNVMSTPADYADKKYVNNFFVGATMENTFVNEGSEDAKWQLRADSPAKGKATHGGDCGAFGGATPYVLSGIPLFLPHITEALVPAKPTDGKITVKLKIANQNE